MSYVAEPVIYREPNWAKHFNPEDFCIFVDLKVEISGRDVTSNATSNKRTYLIQWASSKDGKSTVTFMSGSKVGDTRFLTTNYTNTYLGDIVEGKETNELFGISSIDIEYNSYYVPQVTINFVDIRGVSMFAGAELSHANKFNNIGGFSEEDMASSFFKCFFTFPYPKFTLLVKGFYGEPATYTLNCSDFRAVFDSETGNFKVVAKFVGFTFSFLNDISLNAMLAAPYSEAGGAEYWKARKDDIESDFFLIGINGERVTIPTLGELLVSLSNVDKKVADAVSDTEAAKEQRELEDKKSIMEGLQSAFETYASAFVGFNWADEDCMLVADDNGKNFIILVEDTDDDDIGETIDDDIFDNDAIKTARDALINGLKSCGIGTGGIEAAPKLVHIVKKITVAGKEDYTEGTPLAKGQLSGLEIDKDYIKIEVPVPGSLLGETKTMYLLTKQGANKLNNTSSKNTITFSDEVSETMWDNCRSKIETSYTSGKGDLFEGLKRGKYFNGYRYSIDINADLSEVLPDLENKLVEAQKKVEEEEEKALATILGFMPNIYNFTKIIMAHAEVLIKLIMDCAVSIYDDKENRTVEALNMSGVESDFRTGEENFVPPFPLVAKEKEVGRGVSFASDGGAGTSVMRVAEEEWVGEISPKFKEAEFIIGLMNGAKEVGGIINQYLNATNEDSSDVSGLSGRKCAVEIPVVPTDMVITESPFGLNPLSSHGEFVGRMYLRAFQIFGMNINLDVSEELAGTADAINFYALNRNTGGDVMKAIMNQNQGNSQNLLSFADYFSPIVRGVDLLAESYKKDNVWPWQAGSNAEKGLATQNMQLNLYHYNGIPIIPIHGETFRTISDKLHPEGKSCRKPPTWNNYIPMADKVICDENRPIINTLVFTADTAYLDYQAYYDQIPEEFSDLKDSFKGAAFKNEIENPYNGLNYLVINKLAEGVNSEDPETFMKAKIKLIPPCGKIKAITSLNVNFFTQFEYVLQIDIHRKAFMFTSAIMRFAKIIEENGVAVISIKDTTGALGDFLNGKRKFANVPRWFVYHLGGLIYMRNKAKTDKDAKLMLETFGESSVMSGVPRKEVADLLSKLFDEWATGQFRKIDEMFSVKYKGTGIMNEEEHDITGALAKAVNAIVGESVTETIEISQEKLAEYVEIEDFKTKFKLEEGKDVKYMADAKGFAVEFNPEYDTSLLNQAVLMPMMLVFTPDDKNRYCGDDSLTSDVEPAAVNSATMDSSKVQKYWEAFIKKLQELYATNPEKKDEGGVVLKDETPIDLKIALYHYCKSFYDKWIAGTNMTDDFDNAWKLSTFFNPSDIKGGRFHFIDSFFNYIGDEILVNPETMVEDILSCTTEDGFTLLTLLNDLMSKNRFKFICMENFKDLSNPGKMDTIFTPVSFTDMTINENEVDFVGLYTYEYSSHADVGNSDDYKDDGFMLNHKDMYPLSVTQKTETRDYPLPAFGVAYGMQNQNYFSNIDISTEKPMVTEQSLLVQYKLCGVHSDIPKESKYVTYGQDLFTIYANNSYTCNVEMMGNAWIQPTMYFCLTNVPMFRGSYLIERVKHSITPGDMKTTFTGVRMANTSTRIAKNWIKKAYNPQSISLSSVATAFGVSGGGNGYSSDGTYVGNEGVSSGEKQSTGRPAAGSWQSAVEEMGKWYQANVHTYQKGPDNKHRTGSRKWYDCPLINNKVGDDCSSFVSACVSLYLGTYHVWGSCGDMMRDGSDFDNIMKESGFKKIPYSYNELKPMDVIIKSSHTEVFAKAEGKCFYSWSWGNTHDGINGHDVMPSKCSSSWITGNVYKYIYRKV